MVFSVKYRDNSGALCEKSVEAENKSACVSMCRLNAISPISISKKDNKISTPSNLLFKSLSLTTIFLSLITTVFIYYFKNRSIIQPIAVLKNKSTAHTNLVTVVNTRKTKVSTNIVQRTERKKYPTYLDNKGVLRYKNGMRVRAEEPVRSFTIGGNKTKRFKFTSEEQIAGLLEIIPGSMVFGRMSYGQKFIENFKESLKEDIQFLETDSEYDKRLKEDVIATKKELKAALDRGEDIGKILTETRNQLQELGLYRQKLKKQFEEFRREGPKTAEELKNFVDAVNVMLTESGARPIQLSRLLLRKIEENGETK